MSHTSKRRTFPPPPTSPRALVLRAHPLEDSFNTALVNSWIDGAKSSGASVHVLDVHALEFQPALLGAHQQEMTLEPDLHDLQTAIAGAAQITVAFPVWWGSVPATLKGLLDRALQPGWAYARGEGVFPEKGLTGRTGRLIVTMDTPRWYDKLAYSASALQQMQRATFHFVGIQPTKISVFDAIEKSTTGSRAKMLDRARADGVADGASLIKRFGPLP